ncbi:PLP-dependent decarboxylase [Microbulbifer sp. SSSA002]|uniref:PLP-dependent decarboxylase n=1 Tax=unclassified Microbulbifer TaxID=2619833 RepID=UPI0040392127
MSALSDALIRQLGEKSKQLSTPCYIYSVKAVQDNYRDLKEALGTGLIYSLKANSCLDLILRCGHIFADGIEIASIGELNLLPKGESPRFINNPSADKSFIRAAIASKCHLIIDNLSQLPLIEEVKARRAVNPVVLRLNPTILAHFDSQLKGLRKDHFGLDWEGCLEALAFCKKHDIPVSGFHLFRGSYSFTKGAFDTARVALQVVGEFEEQLGYPLSLVNLGGGFDPNWREQGFDFEQYRNLMSEFPAHISIVHESGRAIMGSAGYFVTEVRYIKSIDGDKYAVCDGGMAQNFLLAKTESTFKRFQQPLILRNAIPLDESGDGQKVLLVGTSCNKEDVIGEVNNIDLQVGDLALFDGCGAYNASYTVAPFLKLPAPTSYLVE